MKKAISIIALGTLLATNSLLAGGNIVAPAAEVVAVPVQTDTDPFYIGIGVIWAGVSRDCFERGCTETIRLKDSTWGGIVRVGYDFNQYIGIEGRALKATIDSDWAETTHYGIFLKPMMPVGEQVNIYGLLGWGHTKVVTDSTSLQDEFTHNGFSYGIGLEYDLSSKKDDYDSYKKNPDDVPAFDRPFDGQGDQEVGWGLWIDYQNLMNNEGPEKYKTNIVSFGVTYDF